MDLYRAPEHRQGESLLSDLIPEAEGMDLLLDGWPTFKESWLGAATRSTASQLPVNGGDYSMVTLRCDSAFSTEFYGF